MEIIVAIISVCYTACGVYAFGYSYAYWNRKYFLSEKTEYSIPIFLSLIGPIGLLCVMAAEQTKYGLQFGPFPKKRIFILPPAKAHLLVSQHKFSLEVAEWLNENKITAFCGFVVEREESEHQLVATIPMGGWQNVRYAVGFVNDIDAIAFKLRFL